jgi:hypothetical protein
MHNAGASWWQIVELARMLDERGHESGTEQQVMLARLVLSFDRTVVKHPVRSPASETRIKTGIASAPRAETPNGGDVDVA